MQFLIVEETTKDSQSPLEKFFGQARQRKGGNFYIDIGDVIAAAKVQDLHQLVKADIIPNEVISNNCEICKEDPAAADLEHLADITICATQDLIDSSDTLKHKVIYIGGFLMQKINNEIETDENLVSSEFLEELNRGGLKIPTLNMEFLVYSAITLFDKLHESRKTCCNYFMSLLKYVDTPYSKIDNICKSLTKIVFKAYVLNNSDGENELGCLRRKEKLAKQK